MSFIPLLATFVTVFLGSALSGIEEGLLFGLIVALVSSQLVLRNKFNDLQRQIDRLREKLTEVKLPASDTMTESEPDVALTAAAGASPGTVAQVEPSPLETPTEDDSPPIVEPPAAASSIPPAAVSPDPEPVLRAKNPADHIEDLVRRAGNMVISYFTDGNIFVRIGILILFFGVAFLLKYAAENSRIPVEIRFMGAAFGGLLLLTFGWRLRLKQAIYALLLQGGGIGVIYITIFAAFRLADLLPPTLTFILLVFFAAFTVALAILQDSRALAIYAVLGGFLAPFLASSGGGNYIGLFSYYALLNAAVLAIAWFRAWRALNLLGFVFTFGVFVLWVAFDYRNEFLYPGIGFLLLFFLMYSLIGVLYALRQPEHLTGVVDGTLVFGTPVIVSGLLMVMLRDFDYGIAGACAAMGLYYIGLARFTWRRVGEDFRLLAEAMLAVGVVFATLAIPYSLEGHWSSAAWALEAAGILWVSIRQKRFYAQCFAIALQVGSGLLFIMRNIEDLGDTAWLNPAFIGGIFIALGAFISARMLYLQEREFKLRVLHIPFYIWAMGWWLVSALLQIDAYLQHEIIAMLLLFSSTAGLLVYLDRLRHWDWMPAAINAALLLPVLILISIYSWLTYGHPLATPDLYFWLPALIASYWIIARLETVAWPNAVNIAAHTAFVVFAALLWSSELVWMLNRVFSPIGEGYSAILALMPLIALRIAQAGNFPAIERLGSDLQLSMIGALSAFLFCWSLIINLSNSGDPTPLPYVPFINPVDLTQIAFFLLLLGSLKLLQISMAVQRDHILIILAGLVFVWLTAVLIRSMHHYLAIRFDMSDMLGDTRVQTAISILWTVIGMGAMLLASRRLMRTLWIIGAALVGVVLVKMFFIDLGASGTVERIISFLVVGSLLVATGYFSPIPERPAGADSAEDEYV